MKITKVLLLSFKLFSFVFFLSLFIYNNSFSQDEGKYIQESNGNLSSLSNMIDYYRQGKFNDKSYAEEFYKYCTESDYQNRKKKIEEIVAKNPAYTESSNEYGSYYNYFMTAFPKKMQEFLDNSLIKDINNSIEEAYAMLAGGKTKLTKATELAECAVLVTNGLNMVFPDNTTLQDLNKEAKSALDKMAGSLASIYTSPFHKQNAGKTIFSKSPIEIKKENPTAIINKFIAGDFIYGMFYLKGTFKELTQSEYKLTTLIEVDGNEKANHEFSLSEQNGEMTYLNTEIVPDPATSLTRGCAKFSMGLANLSPRKHKVKVILRHQTGESGILSEGEFELDCSQGQEKLQKIASDLAQKQLDKVRMPESAMKNPSLEKEIKAVLSDWEEKPLRVVITGSEWTINRNSVTGIIEFRSIWTAVAVKSPDGKCKIFYLSFRQDYNGKSYGKTRRWGVGDSEEISCDNVNK
jgi:hypothetical protein